MSNKEFEELIKKEIDNNLFIEETNQPDLNRVMLANTPKGTIYICAVPREGVRDEFTKEYVSIHGQPFPSKSMIMDKIRLFITELPGNLDLYELKNE